MSKPPKPIQPIGAANVTKPAIEPPKKSFESADELQQKIQLALSGLLDPAQSSQVTKQVTQIIAEERFRGPMPHPKHLEGYEKVCPGLADRIMTMAEKSQNRHEDRQDRIVDFEFKDRKLGMILGFLALLGVLSSGSVTIIFGHVLIGGGLLAASAIGAAITPFINGRASLPNLGKKKSEENPSQSAKSQLPRKNRRR